MGSSLSAMIAQQPAEMKAQAEDQDFIVNAGVTNNSDSIKNAITAAAKDFTSITAIIGKGLDVVFENVTANQSEYTTFAIVCGELGRIMRIDINIFCYTYTAQALTRVTNNVVAVAYTISSVDESKLDADTLRDIVQVCYEGSVSPAGSFQLTSGNFKAQIKAIYQQLLGAMNADRPSGKKEVL
ncbi:hypothetical protein B0H19DRAFT_1239242 [Mycena capillaripes]|nr:hypothetical protein B0H19DRAFT_1239242 [Mycena capillaripes]